MTTYQQGKQPDGAPVTWRVSQSGIVYIVRGKTVELCMDCDSHDSGEMDAICRAFHLAKLAEDYVKAKAAMDAAATAADIESVRAAYYDAARALCEAVR